jgi:tungstate transport system substrate-binding protein
VGAALNAAGAMGTYTISDRGGSLRNKGDLVVAVEGDRRPFNQHGVMLVNSAKRPNVKTGPGQQFIDRLISPPPEGQRTIARYKINGQQLFYPNANHPAACDRKAALDYHPATNPAKG